MVVLVAIGAVMFPRPQPLSPEPDAVSFRRNTAAGSGARQGARGGQPVRFSPGRAWATTSIWRNILDANGVTKYKISCVPAWLDTEMYDFDARSTYANAGKEQLKLTLQTLLSQRCHLTLHRTTKRSACPSTSFRMVGAAVGLGSLLTA